MTVLSATEPIALPVHAFQIEAQRLASSTMSGMGRRALQAARVFGWGRKTIQLGLHAPRTDVIGGGASAAYSGNRLGERHSLSEWAAKGSSSP